jgi:phosphoserine phosphatase
MLNLVLVLTARPGSRALSPDHIDAVCQRVPVKIEEFNWLARGEAWDAPVALESAAKAEQVHAAAIEALAGAPVDVNLVANGAGRRKKLLVADMESTIIGEELIDEIADFAGLREEISAVTARAMRGEIEFEGALRERVALLAGLEAAILEQVSERITLTPGAETLVMTMKRHGATCALVSGGFAVFAERVASRLGFDAAQANRLEIDGGKLTGRVAEPILGRDAKLAALRRLASERGLDLADTLAVGDGANDLAMIREAGLGVAFRAKPVVAAEAKASIVHGDLTGVLYLQGYRKEEFAA